MPNYLVWRFFYALEIFQKFPKGKSMNMNPPVFTGFINGQTLVLCNARALHEHMRVPSKFSGWILHHINKYGLVENLDYFKFSTTDALNKKSPIVIKQEDLKKYVPASQKKSTNGRPLIDYVITTKTAEQVALARDLIAFKSLAETMRNLSADKLGNIYLKGVKMTDSGLKSNENSQAVKIPDALVPVFNGKINGKEQLLCNARKLHEHLQVGRDFSTWIKGKIEEYGFVENQDYILFFPQTGENSVKAQEGIVAQMGNKSEGIVSHLGKKSGRGRPSIEYHLTLDMAKELAMVEKTEIGRQVRKYFIQCESQIYKGLNSQTIDSKKQLEDYYLERSNWHNAVANSIDTLIWAHRMNNLLLHYMPVLENHPTQQYSLFLTCIYDRYHLFKQQYKSLEYYAKSLQNKDYANTCLDSLSALEKHYDRP